MGETGSGSGTGGTETETETGTGIGIGTITGTTESTMGAMEGAMMGWGAGRTARE